MFPALLSHVFTININLCSVIDAHIPFSHALRVGGVLSSACSRTTIHYYLVKRTKRKPQVIFYPQVISLNLAKSWLEQAYSGFVLYQLQFQFPVAFSQFL